MYLDDKAIEDLADVITGGNPDSDKSDYDPCKNPTPYKRGKDLLAFFNNYSYKDVYKKEFPRDLSRKQYTILKLKELNNTKKMEKLLNDFVFSRNYINTDFDVNQIATHINTIIKYCGYELTKVNNEYVVTGEGLIKDEPVQIEATFEEIQSKIIAEIKNAKYTIWVAVAWFTDDTLFKELISKKEEGLNIQIIILKDQINSSIPFEKYFETYRISPFGMCDNIFHQKFCVIDLQTVIHGSYNWTKKAKFNKEDITTVKNRELAEQYADRFKQLKQIKN